MPGPSAASEVARPRARGDERLDRARGDARPRCRASPRGRRRRRARRGSTRSTGRQSAVSMPRSRPGALADRRVGLGRARPRAPRTTRGAVDLLEEQQPAARRRARPPTRRRLSSRVSAKLGAPSRRSKPWTRPGTPRRRRAESSAAAERHAGHRSSARYTGRRMVPGAGRSDGVVASAVVLRRGRRGRSRSWPRTRRCGAPRRAGLRARAVRPGAAAGRAARRQARGRAGCSATASAEADVEVRARRVRAARACGSRPGARARLGALGADAGPREPHPRDARHAAASSSCVGAET